MKAEEWTNLVLFFLPCDKNTKFRFFVVYHLKTFTTKRNKLSKNIYVMIQIKGNRTLSRAHESSKAAT